MRCENEGFLIKFSGFQRFAYTPKKFRWPIPKFNSSQSKSYHTEPGLYSIYHYLHLTYRHIATQIFGLATNVNPDIYHFYLDPSLLQVILHMAYKLTAVILDKLTFQTEGLVSTFFFNFSSSFLVFFFSFFIFCCFCLKWNTRYDNRISEINSSFLYLFINYPLQCSLLGCNTQNISGSRFPGALQNSGHITLNIKNKKKFTCCYLPQFSFLGKAKVAECQIWWVR